MARLLLFLAGLIVYGSLFPFNFQASVAGGDAIVALWPPEPLKMAPSDILSNTLTFVPLGFVIAVIVGHARVSGHSMIAALFATWVLAVALQLAQVLLPGRYAALNDAVWNGVGIALGGLLGALIGGRGLFVQDRRDALLSAPMILMSAWIGFLLLPLLPTLDPQEITGELWALVLAPRVSLLQILHHCVGWLVVFYLWRRFHGRGRAEYALPWLVLAVLAAQIVVADNALSAGEVLGAVAALILWWSGLRKHDQPPGGLAMALVAVVIFRGLAPFVPRTEPAIYYWLPLSGILLGTAVAGMLALLSKMFLYGSLVWLLHEADNSWRRAATVAAVLLAAIEIAQFFFAGHTPETTDPLLALLLAAIFDGLDPDKADDDTHFVGGRRPLRRKIWRPPRRISTLQP